MFAMDVCNECLWMKVYEFRNGVPQAPRFLICFQFYCTCNLNEVLLNLFQRCYFFNFFMHKNLSLFQLRENIIGVENALRDKNAFALRFAFYH